MNTVKPNAKLSRVWHLMRPEARKVFADFVGKSVNSFRHVAEGRRGISSDLAIRIEKASEKLDTRPRLTRMLFVLVNPPEPEGDGGVLEGTNRTTSGAIGQP
jgi:hypothetical protein